MYTTIPSLSISLCVYSNFCLYCLFFIPLSHSKKNVNRRRLFHSITTSSYHKLIFRLDRRRGRRRVILVPMLRNIHAAADPDVVKALDIVQETGQSCGTSRFPDQAAMQTHRHHLGASLGAFLAQVVKAILWVVCVYKSQYLFPPSPSKQASTTQLQSIPTRSTHKP